MPPQLWRCTTFGITKDNVSFCGLMKPPNLQPQFPAIEKQLSASLHKYKGADFLHHSVGNRRLAVPIKPHSKKPHPFFCVYPLAPSNKT